MEWRAENWRSGDVLVGWRHPLVSGTLSRAPRQGIRLIARSVSTGEEFEGSIFSLIGSRFTGIVALHPGDNEIIVRACDGNADTGLATDEDLSEEAMVQAALRMSLGDEPSLPGPSLATTGADHSQCALRLTYKDLPRKEVEGSHHVRFVYATPSDDASGTFEGYDSACGRSPIEEASRRIQTMAILLQAVVADRSRLHSFCPAASTFTFVEDSNAPGPEVIVHQSSMTRSQAEAKSDHELWNHFESAIKRPSHCIDVVLMGMTRYDRAQRKPLAHTALGGNPVALFGTGNMHLWPTSLSEVSSAALDTSPVCPELFFDDSGGRGSRWANFSTGIGAVLHELLHSVGCMHVIRDKTSSSLTRVEQPCMARGFDHINRVFMLQEPGMPCQAPFLPSDQMSFHAHTALRLWYSPFVNKTLPTQSTKGPGIKVIGDVLKAGSADGLVELSIVHLQKGDVVFTYSFAELPMMVLSIPLEHIRRLDALSGQALFGCVAMDSTGHKSEKCNIFPLVSDSSGGEASALIEYGSDVTISHVLSGRWLASQATSLSHPGGSGYQVVNCMKTETANRVQLGHGAVKPIAWKIEKVGSQGDVLRNADQVELTHRGTGQLLHSHAGIPSPMTSQQEVCCYPTGHLDSNNAWQVLVLSRPPTDRSPIRKGDPLVLFHVNTRHYLHSHGGFEGRFTNYHQEVTAWPHRDDDNNTWTIHTS